jgi:Putative auto-transporter adhesin, head GIN domain
MKQALNFFAILLFAGCSFAQNNVVGSGNVTTENRTISSFNKIKLDGVANVFLKQSGEESVKVEADDNLQELIIVEVKDNVLHVKMRKNSNFKKSKKMVVYISFKNIDELHNSLVGNLESDGAIKLDKLKYISSAVGKSSMHIEVENLDMNISAVGNTELEGKAKNCSFVNSAVGNFDGADLEVETIKLRNSAVGNTTYNAKNADVKNSAIGKTKNKNKNAAKAAEEL